MAQNTSHAAMAQRKEPPDSLDFFPTPLWATRALVKWLIENREQPVAEQTVWEPACGQGHMVRALAEQFGTVIASDCHDYGHGAVHDFLMPGPVPHTPDWIITNPPFLLAEQFIQRGLELASIGVAMLCRLQFLESIGRYERLFSQAPPIVLVFTDRVTMLKGRLQTKDDRNTATAYAWFVWPVGSVLVDGLIAWIPPCRKQLERPGDYA